MWLYCKDIRTQRKAPTSCAATLGAGRGPMFPHKWVPDMGVAPTRGVLPLQRHLQNMLF